MSSNFNRKNRSSSSSSTQLFAYENLEDRVLLAADVLSISTDGVWHSLDQDVAAVAVGKNYIQAESFGLFDAQEQELFRALESAPLEFTPGYEANAAILSVPTPTGGFERFAIVEAPIMAAELQAEFPQIKTYRGQGIDQPAATIRLDYTVHGFHAQVLSPDGQYFVDPYFHLQTDLYMSYFKADQIADLDRLNTSEALYNDSGELIYQHSAQTDLEHDHEHADHDHEHADHEHEGHDHEDEAHEHHHHEETEFADRVDVGEVPDENVSPGAPFVNSFAPDFGSQLRTYETAVAATGEYTQFHGGTVAAGQSAIVTAINRVTGVYEIDVAVRLELVGNNSSIVYTNAGSDPYSNTNGGAMLGQNQSNLDSVIGNSNYDIGHVFSTGGGGVALLGVIGQTGAKAQGVTGQTSPTNDSFWIDYVAHEMGHQFGGNHTFNGNSGSCAGGQRNGSTAYEPGSASTIQGYAGICGNDNLQNNSDAMFHSISIDEIRTEVTTGTGNSSATITNTGNAVPVINAGSNYTIPDQTPFELTATGSDSDGNGSLTYSWEQRDLGPQRDVNASDNGSSPIWRTWLPTSDPTRVFPRMSNILAGNTVVGEQYATTNWNNMDFRVVLRDNSAGGGGVVSDDMNVQVVNSGSGFNVTSQSSSSSWTGLETETVTWNVAGTTGSGINTANVDIFFSLDGFTYDIVVATGVPNDGSHDITVPNVDTTTGRIKVKGAGNIFFDINTANITVQSVTGGGECEGGFHFGNNNNGVAVTDNATGTGYMMYSAESVHSRFSNLNPDNANHIVAVRLNGSTWQYNNNGTNVNTAWVNFTPASTDRLLADVDFSADTVTSLQGNISTISGIDAGFSAGDLVFTADQWNGVFNNGEFGVAGTFFDTSAGSATTTFVTPVNNGVAVTDNANGTGYMMYTEESVHTRFTGLNPDNADHLVAIRLTGTSWQYNNNSNVSAWINFSPVATDRILAELDFTADTVTSLQGTDTNNAGIDSGYAVGDIVITTNMWNGVFNNGEFGVSGTFFDTDSGTATTIFVTPVNNGVAVTEVATGTGYMLFSEESVHTRFGGLNPGNADHFIAVRLNGSNWQYNDNNNNNAIAWTTFTPVASDHLVADINFSTDTITSMQGTSSTVSGIDAGYSAGDLVFTANQWAGVFNSGEFGVAGTFFDTATSSPTTEFVTPLNSGIAVTDNATGSGYMMYSNQSVHTRFSNMNPSNADHLAAVRLNGSNWQYNNNNTWLTFTPVASDQLLAAVDFSADTISILQGTDSTINGIDAGYVHGDIVFTPNQWGGSANDGEFGVTGTFFDTDCPSNRPFVGGGEQDGPNNDAGAIDNSELHFANAQLWSNFVSTSDLNSLNLPQLQFGEGPRMRPVDGAQLADLTGAFLADLDSIESGNEIEFTLFDSSDEKLALSPLVELS